MNGDEPESGRGFNFPLTTVVKNTGKTFRMEHPDNEDAWIEYTV